MKGNTKVIEALNGLLTHEMSAADQYFIHSRMYEDWGLTELFERLKHEQEEELDHAARLVTRILFLEGMPNVGARVALRIGTDVPSMMKNDLSYELEVGVGLKKVIALCETEQDYVSRDLLVDLLKDTEEDHTHWLEKQLGLIDKMGLENYTQAKSS
jgi:bacterioferritin